MTIPEIFVCGAAIVWAVGCTAIAFSTFRTHRHLRVIARISADQVGEFTKRLENQQACPECARRALERLQS